jgi:hypothetical protein
MNQRTRLFVIVLSCLLLINGMIQLAAFPVLARKKSDVAYMNQTMLALLDPELNKDKEELHVPVQLAMSTYTRV